mmetsp:Transcript_123/g.364  ORF Transcript_123/g.364 Transcript_123/m.364 type:complete len:305 (+) Transcript_123:77-991(+)
MEGWRGGWVGGSTESSSADDSGRSGAAVRRRVPPRPCRAQELRGLLLRRHRHERLARHLDPFVVSRDHLHLELHPFLHHVVEPRDAVVRNLGDVEQGLILPLFELEDGEAFSDGDHLADENVADADELRLDELHTLDRVFHRSLVRGEDADATVLVADRELGARFALELLDVRPARTDQATNQLLLQHDFVKPRCRIPRLSWPCDGRVHQIEHFRTRYPRLWKRVCENVERDPGGFHIKVDRGDARARASNFEIHIPEAILHPLNVGNHFVPQHISVVVLVHEQPNRNTSDVTLQGNPSIHESE